MVETGRVLHGGTTRVSACRRFSDWQNS